MNNNLINDTWLELPLITPEQIKTARKIKKNFVGEPFKPILSYPLFGT
ncbi:MAG: hypothetical protein KDD45_13530 [Bdellovibrionales bacterium]|nr:hypothetical protein [Bdellovibrionales bacterium]